jgi:hypothetical protein
MAASMKGKNTTAPRSPVSSRMHSGLPERDGGQFDVLTESCSLSTSHPAVFAIPAAVLCRVWRCLTMISEA